MTYQFTKISYEWISYTGGKKCHFFYCLICPTSETKPLSDCLSSQTSGYLVGYRKMCEYLGVAMCQVQFTILIPTIQSLKHVAPISVSLLEINELKDHVDDRSFTHSCLHASQHRRPAGLEMDCQGLHCCSSLFSVKTSLCLSCMDSSTFLIRQLWELNEQHTAGTQSIACYVVNCE